MSSQTLRDIAQTLDVGVKGIEQLQALTKIGGVPATEILAAIDAGLGVIVEGFTGKTDASVVDAQLKSITDKIIGNDAAIDQEIAKKFDPGGEA